MSAPSKEIVKATKQSEHSKSDSSLYVRPTIQSAGKLTEITGAVKVTGAG
jgi:hypothetical protein